MIAQPTKREALAFWLTQQVNNHIGTETQDAIVMPIMVKNFPQELFLSIRQAEKAQCI